MIFEIEDNEIKSFDDFEIKTHECDRFSLNLKSYQKLFF